MLGLKYDEDFVISVFCTVDNLFAKIKESLASPVSLEHSSSRGRHAKMSISETTTFGLLFLLSDTDSFKDFRNFTKLEKYFQLNEYSRLLRKIKSSTDYLILGLVLICHFNRQSCSLVKLIDSMPLAVCRNKRIFTYKVSSLPDRGKGSIGWFYGFKLHLLVDQKGHLLNFRLTPGNVSDKNHELVGQLLKDINGVVIGDKGYQSNPLFQELYDQGIYWLTGLKKSVRLKQALVIEGYHELKKLRQKIEQINGQLKYRQSMESSLPRSNDGYLWRYIFALTNYVLLNQFMSIK